MEAQPLWNFPVGLADLFTASGHKMPNVKAVIRTDRDEPLATVSDRYNLISHQDAMNMVEPLVKKFGSHPETKFVTEKNGARVVATHTFKNHLIDVQNRVVNDKVAFRISVINSYDGATPLVIKVGAMVLRCLNGMTTFGEAMDLSFRHVGTADQIVLPDPDVVWGLFEGSKDKWNEWGARDVTGSEFDEITTQGERMQVLSLRQVTKYQSEFSGAKTMWDLYNAYTRVLTHELKIQGTSRLNRFDRLNSIFNNVGSDVQQPRKLLN